MLNVAWSLQKSDNQVLNTVNVILVLPLPSKQELMTTNK